MNPERLIGVWLRSLPALAALVGNRIALAQLPQGTQYPALVFTVVDAVPQPVVDPFNRSQRVRARVQMNALAADMAGVKAIQAVLRTALDFQHQRQIDGKTVVSSRADILGPSSKDNEAGVYTQSQDYVIHYYE